MLSESTEKALKSYRRTLSDKDRLILASLIAMIKEDAYNEGYKTAVECVLSDS